MSNFKKRKLTPEENELLVTTARRLQDEYKDITKMIHDMENDVNKLHKLRRVTTKNVIVGTITIEKRIKQFRILLKDLRNCFCYNSSQKTKDDIF